MYGRVALSSIGSAIGCTIAGKAACGAVLEVDGGYGRYIGLSVLPSSIVIYGIVIMFSLNRAVGPATSPGLFGVGLLVGVAMLYIGVLQGECCAAAINASKSKPAIFGISATPVPGKAHEQAAKLKVAGEDAIRLAMRDTTLSLEADLTNRFQNMLRGLVKGVLQDPAFLQRLILEVAGKAAPSTERAELLIPAEVVSLEDLRRKPEEAKPGSLTHFVLSLGGGMLREGLSFGVTDGLEAGGRAQVAEEDVPTHLAAL